MGFVARTAEYGMVRLAGKNFRPSFRPASQGRISKQDRIKYFLVGLAYLLKDTPTDLAYLLLQEMISWLSFIIPYSENELAFSSPGLDQSQRPNCGPVLNVLSTGEPSSGSVDYLSRVRTIIETNLRGAVAKEQIANWYLENHGAEIPEDRLSAALDQLKEEKLISVLLDQEIEKYDQPAHIKDIAAGILDFAQGKETLVEMVDLMESFGRELFEKFDLYFDRAEIGEIKPKQARLGELDFGAQGKVYWVARETTRPLYGPNHTQTYVEEVIEEYLVKAMKNALTRIAETTDKTLSKLWEEGMEEKEAETRTPWSEEVRAKETDFWTKYSEFIRVFGKARDHVQMAKDAASLLRIDDRETVVVAGCGVGNEVLELKAILEVQGKRDVVFNGFDITPAMIDRARKNPKLKGVNLTVNDWCERLPYKDGSVDKFVAQLVFGYVPDADKAFEEVMRVLKPGGVFAFVVPIPKYSVTRLFLRGVWHTILDKQFTPEVLRLGWKCMKYMREIKKKIKSGLYRGYHPQELKEFLEARGAENVTAQYSTGSKYFTVVSGVRPSNGIR